MNTAIEETGTAQSVVENQSRRRSQRCPKARPRWSHYGSDQEGCQTPKKVRPEREEGGLGFGRGSKAATSAIC